MFRNARLQMIGMLAIGSLLGFVAASGKLDVFRKANAAPSPSSVAARESSPDQAAAICCLEGATKGQLVAMADLKAFPAAAQVAAPAATQVAPLALAQAAEEKAIVFEIMVPADALLEVDGDQTTATGEARTFQTPPLRVGGRYNYTLKATARGKTVTRQVHLAHGAANSIDLRADFQTARADKANTTQLAKRPGNSKKPNIVVIMGDDVGIWNIGAYHRGTMSGKTPNLDKLASQGMLFTDYYAEASCTAGRCNFMTGQLPIRVGLTTVGQAGADVGMPAECITTATVLKSMGYATGQFGKNHFGDLNKYLPTLHGLDEFHGYLYHLDALSDPFWHSFPTDPAFLAKNGPRSVIHCWATDTDDPTVMPRWGKVGKQKIQDDGPLAPFPNMAGHENWHANSMGAKYNMETFDNVLLEDTFAFMDKAKKDGKPFFVWHNTTRMHVWTFLSEKYRALMNAETNYGIYEAGMAQLDDIVGSIMKKLDDMAEAENTILVFTTDNGAMVFSWPDGGMTPYAGQKGMATEGAFRVPCIARWPGHIKPGTVENGIFSGLDWLPTFVAAAGDPDINSKLLKGVKIGDRTYKNHLDGYNQLDLLQGKGPSARHEVFYFAGPRLGGLRIDNFKFSFFGQPEGWPGAKLEYDMPLGVNIRQDPFERTPINNWGAGSADYLTGFLAREFWRFVEVQNYVAKLGESAIEYPPMQDPASFSLTEVKKKIDVMIKKQHGE